MWVGSRSCRYKGRADIILYGNQEDMAENHHVGRKYLWVGASGVLEMHGEEKMSWANLNEHIFRKKSLIFNLKNTFKGNKSAQK